MSKCEATFAKQQKRDITMTSKASDIKVAVFGLEDEVRVRWAYLVRRNAKDLPELPCEEEDWWFLGQSDGLKMHVVASSSCVQADAPTTLGRPRAGHLLQSHLVEVGLALCGGQMCDSQLGDGFLVASRRGRAQRSQKMLDLLARQGHLISLAHGLEQMEFVWTTHCFLAAVLESIIGVLAGRLVNVGSSAQHPFARSCRPLVVCASSSRRRAWSVVSGTSAIQTHFEALQGNASLDFNDLDDFHTFGFLLDGTQKDWVTEITQKVMPNVHISIKQPIEASEKSQ